MRGDRGPVPATDGDIGSNTFEWLEKLRDAGEGREGSPRLGAGT